MNEELLLLTRVFVRRVDMQTWSFVMLFNCSAGFQFYYAKPARTPPKMLVASLNY